MTREELLKSGATTAPDAPAKTYSRDELLKMGATPSPSSAPAKSGGAVSDLKEAGANIVTNLKKRGADLKETVTRAAKGDINPLSAGLRVAGAAAGAVTDTAVGGVMGAAKAILPESAEDELRTRLDQALTTPIGRAGVEAVLSIMDKYSNFKGEHPELAKDLEAGANVLSVLPVERVAKAGIDAAAKGATRIAAGAEKASDAIRAGAGRVASTAGNLTETVSSVGGKAANALSTVPKRLEVANQAAKLEAAELAKAAPEVRAAAKLGVKVRHANIVKNATPAEKEIFRDMFNQAKTFETDRSSVSPADIAGRQLQKRVAEADALRQSIGEELGAAVKGLAGQEAPARLSVLKRLQSVPGLQGLKISNSGALDFSNTTLATNLTKSDRAIIEEAWRSIKGKDALGYHRLRQEIFEVTGGRKKAQVPLTDTQDRALEAIRRGLADSLETISPKYREVNQRYARIAEPLKNLRKSFAGLEGASDDILDEISAKLMRRLTSESMGGSKLKNLLAQLDEALAASGQKSDISLQRLQDFANAIDEYFDVVKDTSFAGQAGLGVRGGARGVFDFVSEKILEGLQSNEIRQKAFEELLFK